VEVELRIERSQNIVCSDSSTLNNILIIVELKLQFMSGRYQPVGCYDARCENFRPQHWKVGILVYEWCIKL